VLAVRKSGHLPKDEGENITGMVDGIGALLGGEADPFVTALPW
jgi:hypothetical protein